jgi:hypothetical protein
MTQTPATQTPATQAPVTQAPAPKVEAAPPPTTSTAANAGPQNASSALPPSAPAASTQIAQPTQTPRAAPAPVPPSIAHIEVPSVVEGNPFTVAVEVSDARNVVAIERRLRDTVGSWSGNSSGSLPVTGLRRQGDTFYIPFHAMDAPARAIVEFNAVTRDGHRGPARTATLVIADSYPAAVRDAASAALSGAVPGACTPSTCGRVVLVRDVQADSHSQSRLYEVTVQMDDNEQYVFTAPYHPADGARMRMSNGSFTRVAQ